MVVTFFEKQFLLGCPKDLCVWMEMLLPPWKSKTRTSTQKMLLKELYFLCGSQKKFCAGRTKLFVHCWWKVRKKVFVRVLLSFSANFRTLKPVRWARMSCEQLHFVHLTAVNTKNILKNDQNSFVRPAQNNFCEPQENKVPLATFFFDEVLVLLFHFSSNIFIQTRKSFQQPRKICFFKNVTTIRSNLSI